MDPNTVKQTCVETSYATCIKYELDLPEFSTITHQCPTIEQTTEDIYKLVEEIRVDSNLSILGQQCLSYTTGVERNTLRKVLLAYETEICNLKEKVETLETSAICDKNITGCGLDLSGLSDICNEPITTLKQLLQYLITNSQPTP